MKISTSKKFQERIEDFFEYCQLNYGMTVAQKKRDEYDNILNRLKLFPESYRIEPLLQGKSKEYRAINFEKDFKIIYSIAEDEIRLENLWNTKRNPKSLKKDI
ncbi:MAG: hypothetical protein J6T96_16135 [Bacteroidales bacterium]|nr:hypothetical protein [Bacteroidales bacterium]MBP5681908.1 hypothetical protein [Bacteroidales bacterium]